MKGYNTADVGFYDPASAVRTVVNGAIRNPETLTMSGDANINPTLCSARLIRVKVDAGGAARNIYGIGNVNIDGISVQVIHTGGENLTLVHDSASGSAPMLFGWCC